MAVSIILWCVAALAATAVLAVAIGPRAAGARAIYGVCIAASTVAFVAALAHLALDAQPSRAVLPLGLPWLGAHFRVDALAAFFLAVVNLGAAAASLYGLGYCRHETAPMRVLPFFPAFLAGLNLVVAAD
ncbi:MAG TPA: hydrogenase 4 subunit B, partial [Alphaproteobacteria bacterium]